MRRMEKELQKKDFSLTSRLKSFGPAFHGIGTLLRYEHNARIHLFILIIVLVAGILFTDLSYRLAGNTLCIWFGICQ